MLQTGLRSLIGILLAAALVACGQMGPLYMPKEEPVKTSPAPDADQPASETTATPTTSK